MQDHQPQSESESIAAHWTQAHAIVCAFVASTIRHHHDVEDVLQEVAVAVARHFREWRGDRPFAAWAIGIAKHKVADYHRKHTRDRELFDTAVLDRLESAYEIVTPEMREMHDALRECMQSAQGRARRLLELRYQRELLPAQIAQKVGMTANAVSVMLHRLRNAMAECIRRRLDAGGRA